MGFNDQEIVALSGAHNLGRCHADRSGFEGPWVNNPTRFSNQYFKLLLKLKWQKKDLNREGAQWQVSSSAASHLPVTHAHPRSRTLCSGSRGFQAWTMMTSH